LLPVFQKRSADGKIYSLPVDYSAYGVFYNQDVFKKLNLALPKTYTEFLNISETIKAAGIEPIALGAKDNWTLENMVLPMYASLTKIARPNFSTELYEGKAQYSDADFKRPFQALAELQEKSLINKGALGIDFQQAVSSLIEGKTAMIITGSFVVGTAATLDANASLGYFPFPAEQGDPALLMNVDKSLVYSSKGKNVELAKKFIDFFARADIMKLHIEELKSIPTLGDTNAQLPQALLDLGASAAKYPSFSQGYYIPGRLYQMMVDKLLPEIITGKGATDARFAEMDKLLKEELQNPKVTVPVAEK
jgi:ABC-type glycerol-3-phosphate transport system substrate-binding protein